MIDYLKSRIDVYLFFTFTAVLTLVLMSLVMYFSTGKTDTIFEEAAEDIIEHHTGIEIDLSP